MLRHRCWCHRGTRQRGSGELACERTRLTQTARDAGVQSFSTSTVTSCRNENAAWTPLCPDQEGRASATHVGRGTRSRCSGAGRLMPAHPSRLHAQTATSAPHWLPEVGTRSGRAVASASVTGRARAQGLSRGRCVSTSAETCSRHGSPDCPQDWEGPGSGKARMRG